MEKGPAWVGIGAQRSGTTWFADALCRHPGMSLAGERKELHYFDRFLHDPFTAEDAASYPAREYTPGYLRWPWVPQLVRRSCPDALLIVLLRDPVERFFSAMRWHQEMARRRPRFKRFSTYGGSDAAWGGMYEHHLRMWASEFPREQIHVEQYERATADPASAVERVWARLGLEPVPLGDVSEPSRTSTKDENPWEWMRPQVRSVYETEILALEAWGVDVGLWPNF